MSQCMTIFYRKLFQLFILNKSAEIMSQGFSVHDILWSTKCPVVPQLWRSELFRSRLLTTSILC